MGKTYLEMAVAAIASLKNRTGSSGPAIKAHIIANNKGIDFKQVRLNHKHPSWGVSCTRFR